MLQHHLRHRPISSQVAGPHISVPIQWRTTTDATMTRNKRKMSDQPTKLPIYATATFGMSKIFSVLPRIFESTEHTNHSQSLALSRTHSLQLSKVSGQINSLQSTVTCSSRDMKQGHLGSRLKFHLRGRKTNFDKKSFAAEIILTLKWKLFELLSEEGFQKKINLPYLNELE